MHKLIFIWLWIIMTSASAQSKENMFKQSAFHTMINTLITHSIDTISTARIADQEYLFLDARESKEFEISRIKNAKNVGYEKFDIACMKDIDKDTNIVVYCSIGYRSEKIGEKLKAAGFMHVKNLYGGIFEWVNSGRPLVDNQGKKTNLIHGYSRTWGIWVDSYTTVYD